MKHPKRGSLLCMNYGEKVLSVLGVVDIRYTAWELNIGEIALGKDQEAHHLFDTLQAVFFLQSHFTSPKTKPCLVLLNGKKVLLFWALYLLEFYKPGNEILF
ncbi:hypothetical protein XENTR_v10010246 [Xenopus tropicalis]|nr:hypothetical protein XENTR_v10010246 [Xenopus tropicalis]